MSTPANPVRHRPLVSTAAARGRPAAIAEKKRPRSPCSDELLHRKLETQCTELRRLVVAQRNEMAKLENSILSFYYTYSIRYQAVPLGGRGDGAEVTETAPGSPTASRTGYYLLSEISKLRQEQEVLGAAQAQELHELECSIAMKEKDMNLVKENLAAQQTLTQTTEEINGQLQAELRKQQDLAEELRAAIALEKQTIMGIENDKVACVVRKRALEEKKQRQMASVESTRQELVAARAETQVAMKQVRRREAIVKELQRQIEQRRNRLKRRKLA